ncbi:PqqD family protein [Desulfopila aestuarii]|nr:PqqD family protein [Desulfopila aestuarii]
MKFFRSSKTRPPALSRSEALACVPEIVPAVSWQSQESGDILIEYPLVVKPLLKAIFSRFNRESTENLTRKLQLDSLGSQVWVLIDGSNSVGEIIRTFADSSTITTQEAEQSVTTFLRELGKRGLIILR